MIDPACLRLHLPSDTPPPAQPLVLNELQLHISARQVAPPKTKTSSTSFQTDQLLQPGNKVL